MCVWHVWLCLYCFDLTRDSTPHLQRLRNAGAEYSKRGEEKRRDLESCTQHILKHWRFALFFEIFEIKESIWVYFSICWFWRENPCVSLHVAPLLISFHAGKRKRYNLRVKKSSKDRGREEQEERKRNMCQEHESRFEKRQNAHFDTVGTVQGHVTTGYVDMCYTMYKEAAIVKEPLHCKGMATWRSSSQGWAQVVCVKKRGCDDPDGAKNSGSLLPLCPHEELEMVLILFWYVLIQSPTQTSHPRASLT